MILFTNCSPIINFETKNISVSTPDQTFFVQAKIKNQNILRVMVFAENKRELIEEYDSPFINRKKIISNCPDEDFIKKIGKPVMAYVTGEDEKELIYFQKFYSKFQYGIDNRIIKIHIYKGMIDSFKEEYITNP